MVIHSGIVKYLSIDGLGIVRLSTGNWVLLRNAFPGDEVEFTIPNSEQSLQEKTILGELIAVKNFHYPRRKSPCIHSTQCQGCPLIEMSYQDQWKEKILKLKFYLEKFQWASHWNISEEAMEWGKAENEFSYRNRGQVKVNGDLVGYVNIFQDPQKNFQKSSKIVPIEECLVLSEKSQQILKKFRSILPHPLSFPNPPEKFLWNFFDFDEGIDLAQMDESENFLKDHLNKRRPFSQGNQTQNQKMKEWLKQNLQDEPQKTEIVELFCGSGNFTEVMATMHLSRNNEPHFKIYALEVQGSAVQLLKLKNLHGVDVIEANLFQSNVWKQFSHQFQNVEILVLDPPRSGVKFQRAWPNIMPNLRKILYISCNLESFFKDLQEFRKFGFQLDLNTLRIIDLFPQTMHIEILAVLTKS